MLSIHVSSICELYFEKNFKNVNLYIYAISETLTAKNKKHKSYEWKHKDTKMISYYACLFLVGQLPSGTKYCKHL